MTLKIVIADQQTPGTPPFEQIRTQIADQARAGTLPAGYRLPTVRGLAEQLGLAPNTVAKAYRTLEADGVVETRGRHGTVIAAAGDATRLRAVASAQSFATEARRLGLTPADAAAVVRDALRAAYGEG